MGWFKKKVKEEKKDFSNYAIFKQHPPTPKHIVPIKDLTIFAERAFNEGEKEVEADTLRSLIKHINRYLDKE